MPQTATGNLNLYGKNNAERGGDLTKANLTTEIQLRGGIVKCNGKGEACASVTELKERLITMNGRSSIIKRLADFDGERKGALWMPRAAPQEVGFFAYLISMHNPRRLLH